MAWHFESGTIDGVDVGSLTFAGVMDIPGNVLAGNWRAMVYIDDKSTPQQEEALLNLFTGKLGGPVADLVKLIGEVVGVERVPITFDLDGVAGSVKIGNAAEAEIVAYKGATGKESDLYDTVFSTIPGSPEYVGKATTYRANVPALNINVSLTNHNAVSGPFRFVG